MGTFESTWALCGGWAVDAWLGRESREHHDIDVALFHEDQFALYEHLAGWRLIGHDDTCPRGAARSFEPRPGGVAARSEVIEADRKRVEPDEHVSKVHDTRARHSRPQRVARSGAAGSPADATICWEWTCGTRGAVESDAGPASDLRFADCVSPG